MNNIFIRDNLLRYRQQQAIDFDVTLLSFNIITVTPVEIFTV